MNELEALRAENAKLHEVIARLEERTEIIAFPTWILDSIECDWCSNAATGFCIVEDRERPLPACGKEDCGCMRVNADRHFLTYTEYSRQHGTGTLP